MAITVNLTGDFFSNSTSVLVGQNVIMGGTDAAKLFMMLHELAHLTGANGFLGGDNLPSVQNANNMLLGQHCGKMTSQAGFAP
jgi:hypothetical protein